jgi:hypothetical protein
MKFGIILGLTLACFSTCLSIPPAWAGQQQRVTAASLSHTLCAE